MKRSIVNRIGRTSMRSGLSLFFAAFALFAAPASALILDAGDGRGNTTAPPDDPGWQNVARRLGGPSIVYLGDRWVLTARHVGAGVVEIDGKRFDPIATDIHFITNDDGTHTDLMLFRIDDDPGLPRLVLSESTPLIAEDVILVGHGASRGQPISLGSPPEPLRDGFHWIDDATRRWGTNVISDRPNYVTSGRTRTLAIATHFDRIDEPLGTPQEAQAAIGDSGGALFARADRLDSESGWVLAGLMFTVSNMNDQPPRTSFYGSATFSVDLAHYREQILRVARPICLSGSRLASEPEWACGTSRVGGPSPDNATRFVWPAAALSLMLALALIGIRRRGS
ncbi:MAG: trypsin-like peptidase domain-containing protein [Deltaproteobacteria bacterium]|nr:trypsin-like peptidase domain-containing protein [Deltaproteobacteria bacterium]